MLSQLHVRNLAVIDAAELEFRQGLTVLTGETGAGKSILVDALALALGARADSKAVRNGAERCEISATFMLTETDQALRAWLCDRDLDAEDECLVRRVVTREGRSRGYINGQPVTMQSLQQAGEQLLDICGQQAHQSLRHRARQREILDQFGGQIALTKQVATAHAEWSRAEEAHRALAAAGDEASARQELLGFQLAELQRLDLRAGEFAELEQTVQRLSHSAQIQSSLHSAVQRLYEAEESVQGQLGHTRGELEATASLDSGITPALALLSEAETLIGEATDTLRSRLDDNAHDPAELERIEQRVADTRQLARKHQCEPEELVDRQARLAAELNDLEGRKDRLEVSAETAARALTYLQELAGELTTRRRAAAKQLAEKVTSNMARLGMSGGQFSVGIQTPAGESIHAYGADEVEYQVAANPGQAAGALARVASGGELSRISLALQVVALGGESIGTRIFDEVDAGVGGGVAEIVGEQLRQLSTQAQVLCVTHLPQVASHAHTHLRVSKVTDGRSTRTTVTELQPDERVEEIARMLGGVEITAKTRAHAREMLKLARSKRETGERALTA